MTFRKVNDRVAAALRDRRPYGFKIAMGMAALIMIASALYSTYMIGFAGGEDFRATYRQAVSDNDFPYLINTLRVAITIGLVAMTAGLWSRKTLGFFGSMIATMWIGLVYGWWKIDSAAFLRNAEVTDYSQLNLQYFPHAAGLRGATPWDVIVAIIVAILFLWQVITLVKIVKSPQYE